MHRCHTPPGTPSRAPLRHALLLSAALLWACQSGSDASGRTSEECSAACWRISAAACGDIGQECVDRCGRTDLPPPERCPTEQETYLDCFWLTESYTCDPDLGTTPKDCDDERTALRVCLGVSDAATDSAADSSVQDAATADAARDQ